METNILDLYDDWFMFKNGIREPYVDDIGNGFLLSDCYFHPDGTKCFRLETARRYDTYQEAYDDACHNDIIYLSMEMEVAERYFNELTMADHAEQWYMSLGKKIPERDTDSWHKMYEAWVIMAFERIGDHDMECVRCGKRFDCSECPEQCPHRDKYDECMCSACWSAEEED